MPTTSGVSRSVVWLGIWLCMALVTLPSAGALAGDSPEQTYPSSSIPRVNRDLLLGFLADSSTLMLIDARSPEEFGQQHLPGAINVPLETVNANIELLPQDKMKPIVVYCRSGKRAGLLKDELVARGYTDVQVLPSEQIFWEDDFMVFNCSTT